MAFAFLLPDAQAQDKNETVEKTTVTAVKPATKPYRIFTAGKRITIQCRNSNNNLKRILVWTASGNRIVERHDLDEDSFTFYAPSSDKIFFMLIETANEKRYTEKIGVQ